MLNKIIISVLAASFTLTLFPLLFLGIYTLINSGDIQKMGTGTMLLTFFLGISYAGTVLFGSYKAIQNLQNPKKAYVFFLMPLIVIGVALLFRAQ